MDSPRGKIVSVDVNGLPRDISGARDNFVNRTHALRDYLAPLPIFLMWSCDTFIPIPLDIPSPRDDLPHVNRPLDLVLINLMFLLVHRLHCRISHLNGEARHAHAPLIMHSSISSFHSCLILAIWVGSTKRLAIRLRWQPLTEGLVTVAQLVLAEVISKERFSGSHFQKNVELRKGL